MSEEALKKAREFAAGYFVGDTAELIPVHRAFVEGAYLSGYREAMKAEPILALGTWAKDHALPLLQHMDFRIEVHTGCPACEHNAKYVLPEVETARQEIPG